MLVLGRRAVADQHAVGDLDHLAMARVLVHPADLYVGFHDRCPTATLPVLYRNPGEDTCVLDLRAGAFHGL